jgi:hypothetical protein
MSKKPINNIIENQLWISDILMNNLILKKTQYSKINIICDKEYKCLDIIILKITSIADINKPITIKVNNKILLDSDILLNKNWITYNFIDLNIYGIMRNIEISPIEWVSSIKIESRPRNDDIFNLNNLIVENYKDLKKESKYKIAIISNEFTYNNFSLEFICDYISNDYNIIKNLNIDNYDFLICESTFRGIDGTWNNHFTKYDNDKYGKNLLLLIEKFKSKSKKTIFYNKEDPIFFDIFYNVSTLFDIVITTSYESASKYKNSKVLSFPFIINPIIHNPMNRICENFAAYPGTFYNFFDERKQSMQSNLEKIINMKNIDIYDRYYIKNKFIDQTNQLKKLNIEYKFPNNFKKYIKPNLNHIQVSDYVYKKYKFIINFNTVQNSTTMCSRRAIECAGCGSNIISDYNDALNKFYKDKIIFFDNITNINDFDKFDDINLYLYYKTHLNLTINHLLELIFDDYKESNSIIIIKNNNTKISSNVLSRNIFIDYDKYLIEDKDKFNDYHKLFILDESNFYDEKYIKKMCLPLKYTNNNIFITNNKTDYFKESSNDYLNNIYIENKYKNNNKIFINDNLRDYYRNPLDISKYEKLDIKFYKNSEENLHIYAIYNEDFINIVNELNTVNDYKINLYVWSNQDIELKDISLNFNMQIINDTTVNSKFGLFLLINYTIKNTNTDKIIILDKYTKFSDILLQINNNCDFYGMHYDENFDIISDNFFVLKSCIFSDNNIFNLNQSYLNYSYEWLLFLIHAEYNICSHINSLNKIINPVIFKNELIYNEFSLY